MNWYFTWGWWFGSLIGYAIGYVIGSLITGDYRMPRIPVIDPIFERLRDGIRWVAESPYRLIDRVRNK